MRRLFKNILIPWRKDTYQKYVKGGWSWEEVKLAEITNLFRLSVMLKLQSLTSQFSKGHTYINAHRHEKKTFHLFAIREKQTNYWHHTSHQWELLILQNRKWPVLAKMEGGALMYWWWECKMVSSQWCGREHGKSSSNEKNKYLIIPKYHSWEYIQRMWKY